MERRIFHGKITAEDLARNLVASFHRGNYQVQQIGSGDKVAVQIATSRRPSSGGNTALSVILQDVEDGVLVELGQQQWFGVAASLGMTALAALRNPLNLLGRLDDLAQDIESLQLSDEVWRVINSACGAAGAGQALSERLRRMVCGYCGTANPVGAGSCVACGAPLGDEQPFTCVSCGFVLKKTEKYCPNCGKPVQLS